MMLPSTEEMLKMARTFVLLEDQRRGRPIVSIVWRSPDKWAIQFEGSEVVNKNLEPVWEPSPSNRDDEFITSTRFSLEEAWALAQQFIGKWGLNKQENSPKEILEDM